MIDLVVRQYMSDDEEAEKNVDGLVRNELTDFPRQFARFMDDTYVTQDAATVAMRDMFNGAWCGPLWLDKTERQQ